MLNARFPWSLSGLEPLAAVRRLLLGLLLALPLAGPVGAQTYANVSVPFNWIDASAHSRLTGSSAPYRLNGSSQVSNCGTALPVLDDSISDEIPIGFTFNFGGTAYSSLRINSNGRIQFGGNNFCGVGTQSTATPQSYPYRYGSLDNNYEGWRVATSLRIYGADLDPTPQGTAGYTTPCVAGNCYLSYALIGSAPNRSFVVTWNNVPEWFGTNRAGGNFNLQIILQENGEFIYQYGVNVHAATGIAQIGWQVGGGAANLPVEYAVPGFGLPANNTAIKFYIPRPVAEYRMEQPSWDGTAGEVIDSSGNGRHAVRSGSAQTTGNGRVCRGATIPLNTALATIDGVQTPVNISSQVGGQGTITFWYRSDVRWNAGNSERQLFEASLSDSYLFFLTKLANGRLRFVLSDTAGGVRTAEGVVNNSNLTAANTWRHVAVSWNFNALAISDSDRLRIYIDGVRAAESAFSTNETLFGGLANLVIGDSNGVNSSLRGGASKSAGGIIDEFRIYNFEGGVGLIQRDMAASGCLGHYAIAAEAGTTCQASRITISAHDAAHNLLVMPNNTTMIQLSSSTGRGDWSLLSGYGVLNNGSADDGVATYLFNGEYQAVFGYQTSTSGSVNFDVSDGQLRESEDPTISIASCSVNFNACELPASGRCTPVANDLAYARLNTKLAATAFSFDVLAVKGDGSLNTAFNGAVKVDLLANVNKTASLDAGQCPAGQTAVVPLGTVTLSGGRAPAGGVAVAANAFSSVSPNYSAYRDVRVRFTCDTANCAPAGLTVCSSDNFAVRPAGFAVSSAMNNALRTGTPKQVAGSDFTLQATAIAGYNGSPQMDRRADPPACFDAGKPYANRVLDHDGICIDRLRDLSGDDLASFPAASPSSGSSTGTFQYHDVGNFSLAAGAVYDASFTEVDQEGGDCIAQSHANGAVGGKIGCNIANQTQSSWFGRFYPDHFTVVSGSASHGCPAGGFTYMGQPAIGLSYTLQARSSGDILTTKYSTGYLSSGMAQVGLIALSDDAAVAGLAGSLLTTRISGWTTPNASWAGGEQKVVDQMLTFSRPAAVPDGPFLALVFGARVTGEQDGAVISLRDMRDTGAACTGSTCTHASLNALTPAKPVFGTLRINPGIGSELLPMIMTAEVLAFNGSALVPHTADTCTTIPYSELALDQWAKNLHAGETCVAATRNGGCNPAGSLAFAAGRANFWLSRPGAGNQGSVRVRLPFAGDYPYLGARSGGANFNADPAAVANFGLFKGPRQIIHLRENF